MKNKLALFDLDGTLFDTKDVNFHAYKEAIKACGIECQIEYAFYCKYCNGNSYKTFLPKIIPGISSELCEEIHRIKKELYPSYLNYAKKNEHLFRIIDCIKEEYYVALVTTASKQNTKDILDCFQVYDKFDFIISQEDVKNVKPNPEGYLSAMDKVGVTPDATIIFEDSEVGLQAAKNSGAKYVKVYGFN